MITPNSLKKGNTIGVISPASPLTRDDVHNLNSNLQLLKNEGYNILLSKHIYYENSYLSGNDRQRAIELMNMFNNNNVKAIICSRGGYGAERIIQYLDFNLIKRNPKIFIGFSNISILLNLFTEKLNFVTYHGPMLKRPFNDFNYQYLINKLENINNYFTVTDLKKLNLKLLNINNFEWLRSSPLAGGNLITLSNTIGTNYEINTNNKILILEDINEEVYKLDRALIQLKNSNKLTNCNGFIIGNFTNCNNSNNISWKKAILSILIPLKKPILFDFPIGHDENNIILPIGDTLLQNQ